MKDKQFAEVYSGDFLAHWTELSNFRKPIIAAVSGYAVRQQALSAVERRQDGATPCPSRSLTRPSQLALAARWRL